MMEVTYNSDIFVVITVSRACFSQCVKCMQRKLVLMLLRLLEVNESHERRSAGI